MKTPGCSFSLSLVKLLNKYLGSPASVGSLGIRGGKPSYCSGWCWHGGQHDVWPVSGKRFSKTR